MTNRPQNRPFLNLTYRGTVYTVRSEGALIALLTWLQLQEGDGHAA